MRNEGRIAYIDAMRGFTMLLVVYSHVCSLCLGNRSMGFNDVFFLFRLPCFFMISGWLFYKAGRVWDGPTVKAVVRKKFMVQIVPTFIFLLLLAPPPLFFSRLGAVKGGYWFTFALFEFFLLYMFSVRWCRRWAWVVALLISVSAFCYDVLYSRYFSSMGFLTKALGFLSFMTWRYYLFFFLGTLVRQHFDTFLRWTSKLWVVVVIILGFMAILYLNATPDTWFSFYGRGWGTLLFHHYLVFAVGGVLGMTMVFTLFRVCYARLSPLTSHFSPLQFVGKRTLDIYLLHYFLLPRFLLPWGQQLQAYDSRLLELVVALSVALVVTALCLAVSWVIRLSPFLAKYLFGVEKK